MSDRDNILNQSAFLANVLEHSEAATVMLNSEGLIVYANKRLEQITGYAREEIVHKKSWKDFVVEEQHKELIRYLQLLRINQEENPERLEVRFLDKQAQLKHGFMSSFLMDDNRLTVMSVVDITEQKQHEMNLEKAKETAENSERLKTAFLANMSHEIRTPINGIVGFADLLKMDDLSDDKKSLYIDQVIHGSHDLLLLIEKIITISRIDSGQLRVSNREFDLNARMNDIAEKFREELRSRGKPQIELTFQAGKPEPSFNIIGDPIRITEVISNLLENAIKFTEEGRIEFGYYFLEKEASETDGEALLFFVKDSGCGIEKSKKKMVFDRFVKILDKEETIYKGAGLGLTICKEIVELLGGSIWLESTKGSGSRFFFNYPLSRNRKSPTVAAKKETNSKPTMDWSDREILIAEDVESNYLYIKELLIPTNVKILRARDGQEAVDLFHSHGTIDLVIMDILMPGMDGYEATAEIRKVKPEIPVIAQSAFTFEGDIQDGLYAGSFNDYIMKPYTRKVLLAVIQKHFKE